MELFFLWLPNAETAITRVLNRVRQGGHPVPVEDVRRRYAAGLRNFFDLYLGLADGWRLYDSSRLPPKLIASEEHGRSVVTEQAVYRCIQKQAGTRGE